jgi:hypothetical protein
MTASAQVRDWISALGGRRFVLTVGAGLVHTILLWFGKITGDQFVLLTTSTVAVYIGASTYQKSKEIASG